MFTPIARPPRRISQPLRRMVIVAGFAFVATLIGQGAGSVSVIAKATPSFETTSPAGDHVSAQTSVQVGVARTAARRPSCNGARATIVGNRRNNRIVGTNHRDVVYAGAGRDVIIGRGGADLICGGRGSDLVDGSAGRDVVYGGNGVDGCWAPTLREHRRHHGCEAHWPSAAPDRDHPRPVTTEALPTLTPPIVRGRGTGGAHPGAQRALRAPLQYDPGTVTCPLGEMHFTEMRISGAYTDPATVGVVSHLWKWSNGWQYRGVLDTKTWTMPNDGQLYGTNMDALSAPVGANWLIGFVFWWWDGQQWVNATFSWPNQYRSFALFKYANQDTAFCTT